MKRLFDFTEAFSSRDPAVILYNGKYYAVAAGADDSICIRCADTAEGLGSAAEKTVFAAPKGTPYSKQLWAPELHVLDGKCYIYVACDDGNNHTHRMYVLENNSTYPMEPYTMHGRIGDESDKWAIDGTIITHNDRRYFVWSGWEGDTNICQDLYIAEMADPYTLIGPRVRISRPEHDWEKLGSTGEEESPFINEGPFGIEIDGELYITYSGAGSWCEHYCIAMLKLTGEDLLDPESWEKCKEPIFCANETVKGAGHCTIVKDANGLQVFFHAWDKSEENVVWNRVAAWQGTLVKKNGKFEIE